jgi:hypothetical protein
MVIRIPWLPGSDSTAASTQPLESGGLTIRRPAINSDKSCKDLIVALHFMSCDPLVLRVVPTSITISY